MLDLSEELRRGLAHPGDRVEGREAQPRRAAAQHPGQGLHGQTALRAAAALAHLLALEDLPRSRALSLPVQRTARREERGQAGENALEEHVAEGRVVLHAEAPAERLRARVDLKADLKFFLVVLADEALALVHDILVLAARQHADALAVLQAVEDEKPVLAPAVVGESDRMLPQQAGRKELGPDLVEQVGLVQPPQRRAERVRVQQLLRLAVIPQAAVLAADGKAQQRELRAARRALQRVFERVGQQHVVRVQEHDVLGVLPEPLEREIARPGGAYLNQIKILLNLI